MALSLAQLMSFVPELFAPPQGKGGGQSYTQPDYARALQNVSGQGGLSPQAQMELDAALRAFDKEHGYQSGEFSNALTLIGSK